MELKRIWIYAAPVAGLLAIIIALAVLFSADSPLSAPRVAGPTTLRMLCDEALRYPVESPDIEHEAGAVGRFMRRTGADVEVEYIHSGELLESLQAGYDGDLALAADESIINAARENGIFGDTRKVAIAVPVILTRLNNPENIESVSDLDSPDIRLAVAGEGAGTMRRASAEILRNHDLDIDSLENIAFTGDTALQTARAVDINRADAAIVWRHVGQRYSLNTTMVEIPDEMNTTTDFTVGVLSNSKHPETAGRFADFLAGAAGQELFEMYGFGAAEYAREAPLPHPVQLKLLCGGGIRPPIDGSSIDDEPGIIERFRAKHPGASVETTYGASNLLLGQLKLTQAGDLFLPGDDYYIEEAKQEGLVYETRTVAWFTPAIMVQRGNPRGIESVADLAATDVQLAVADARAAAIGRITPDIFKKNGIEFEDLDNIAFTGVTAPEIAQAVELGHVDATIVWRPVAMQYLRNSEIVEIAPDRNVRSPLVIAVLETSDNKEAAIRFADFISGEEGRRVFERYNYDMD